MKKKLSVFLACAMAVTLLAGCKSASPAKDASSTTNPGSTEKASSVQKDVKWPTSNIQLIVPSKAGGLSDVHARIFAQYLQETTGKPVVVVNQDSGGGSVAYETVLSAKPDGHTMLYQHTGIVPSYYTGIYDKPISEFSQIAVLEDIGSNSYVVKGDSKYNNMKDLIEDAKANPDKITVGVSIGASSHFMIGQVMKATGAKFKTVQAANEVDKVAAIQGGHIVLGNMSTPAAKQYVDAGKLKVLGVTEAEPDPKFPQFTTIKSQGVDMTFAANFLLLGPKGMDPALVEKINSMTKGMETDKNVQEKINTLSCRFRYYNVQDTQKYIQQEDEKIAQLAKELGLSKR